MLAALKSNNRICTSAQCKKGSNTEKSNQTSFNWIHIWIERISVERGIENIPTHADWKTCATGMESTAKPKPEDSTKNGNCLCLEFFRVLFQIWQLQLSLVEPEKDGRTGRTEAAKVFRLPKRRVLWVKIISIGMPWIALICGQYAFLSFLVSSRVCSCYVPFEGSKWPTSWGQTWLNCSQDGSGSLSNDALFSWGTWSKNRSNPPKSPQTEGLLLNAQKSYMAIQHHLYRFPFFTTERIQKCC